MKSLPTAIAIALLLLRARGIVIRQERRIARGAYPDPRQVAVATGLLHRAELRLRRLEAV